MDENNEDLAGIQSMVMDWVDEQECCNFEKRCMLDYAIIKIGRHDMTDSFGTTRFRIETGGILERPHPDAKAFNSTSVFDDDLASLLRHLPTDAIPLFLRKLGISVDEEIDDLEQKLRCWRDQNINESNRHTLQNLVLIHSDALEETNDSHVLDLNDDELENVIASMTSMKQMDKLKSNLVIKNDTEQSPLLKLKEWRNKCKTEKRRKTLREALYAMELSGSIVDQLPAKHVYQAELVRLAWIMFSTDVWPLTTLLDMDMNNEKSVGDQQMKGTVHLLIQLLEKSKGLHEHRRRDFCVAIRNLGYLDVARSGYFGYDASLSELCNLTSGLSEDEIVKFVHHLGLEKDVLSVCQGPTGAYDNLKLMKIWRNQLRLQPLHFRFELALGLRTVGRTNIASGIIAGRHHTTEVDSTVVESICNNLNEDQLERLRQHLRLKVQEDQSPTTVTAKLVTEWCLKHASAQESDIKPANEKRFENAGEQESESKTANEKRLDNASDQGYVIIPDIEEYDGSIKQTAKKACECFQEATRGSSRRLNIEILKLIIVPVIAGILILAVICVCVAIKLWCRKKQRRIQEKYDPESIPLRQDPQINEKVSFFELWYLVQHMEETNLNILRGALIDLGIPGVEDELTTDTAYDLLFADHLLKVISPQEVEGFVDILTERHCKRLANAVGITDEKKIKTIMDENNEDLVLVQSMINDWVDGQECCNFEKRCMLDDATIKIGRHDMTDSFGTTSFRVETGFILERPHPDARTFNTSSIFDDDLASLLRHLPKCAVPLFLGKLAISVDEESDDLEQKLRCWRDQNIKESKRYSLQALVSIHSDALNETNDSHVLDVNDDELENVIASMTSMKQLEELTSRLGIKNDKEQSHILYLTEWRNRCKMDERRKTLREALNAMKLPGMFFSHPT
eukprot:XP_011670891.1 PREDICTED: uncharacterized protein LOC105441470 [Strongylocentrotus purpuratus]